MIGLFQVAKAVQSVCLQHRWRFCFVGGLALQRWGEPRVTEDVDLTLLTGFGNEEPFIDELLRHFSPRVSDAKEFFASGTAAGVTYIASITHEGKEVVIGEGEMGDFAAYALKTLKGIQYGTIEDRFGWMVDLD